MASIRVTKDGFLTITSYLHEGKSRVSIPDFTGWITFYGDGSDKFWYEFDAEFENGELLRIERNHKAEAFFNEGKTRQKKLANL